MGIIKPIRIRWQKGIKLSELLEIIEAVNKFLFLAGVSGKIEIKFGNPFVLKRKNKDIVGFFNAINFLEKVRIKQEKLEESHYDLFIVKEKIHLDDEISIVGAGRLGIGAILKVVDQTDYKEIDYLYTLYITIIHELGHVFGLLPKERTEDIVYSLDVYKHCANEKCAMHPRITSEVSRASPFCKICLRDLRSYFKKMSLLS